MALTSRRSFLAIGGAGAAASVAYVLFPRAGADREFVNSIIQRNLGYLEIPAATLDQFAEDFIRYEPRMTRSFIPNASLIRTMVAPVRTYREKFERLERRVVTLFLLSTDFFQNDRQIDRTLQYVAFVNPYTAPCANPLARLT